MADLVRQLIDFVYDTKCYKRGVKAEELKSFTGTHVGWKISIDLNNETYPLLIAYDGDWREVIERLEKRLHQDHLHDVNYYNGYKITVDPNLEPRTKIPPKDIKASII